MSTSTVTPEIARFADGVRAALADLPSEEVDDLTEGLEADLAESLAEDLRRTLPDPAAYAAELRLAAGLPGRTDARGSGVLAGLAAGWRRTRTDLEDAMHRSPGLLAVVDFLRVLRPAWWIVRGWLAAWLLAALFGEDDGYGVSGAWWLVVLALVVVSVQWGRGQWHARGVPALILLGNVVAVVALFPALAAMQQIKGDAYYADEGFQDSDGLRMNGEHVTNIYAYDSAGNPLTGVQLFGQDGRPLDPFGLQLQDGQPCADDECTSLVTPAVLETGQSRYNVFPLSVISAVWDDVAGATVPEPGATAMVPPAPLVKAPAVQVPPAPVPAEKVAQPNE